MAEGKKRGNKAMSVVLWLLMAMLILGLGGFGVTNFGTTGQNIATVGDQKIDANAYSNALQQQLQGISQQTGQAFTLAQARQFGLDAQVRQSLIASAALKDEADRIGLSVGDQVVADELRRNPSFQGAGGTFNRETYELVLKQNGLTPADYEANVRESVARSLLVGAVAGGFAAPQAVTDTLYNYIAERRGLSLLPVAEGDLPQPLPQPTEADLRAFYDAHSDRFMAPETRQITYAALLPETVAPNLPVDDAALRDLYNQRIDEFVQPERRLVERLVFPDTAAAEAAKARIDGGAAFEDIVAERGLELTDTDLGDVAKEDLGAAGDAVFALAEPGVVGSFDSDLGPALFRMNGILSAHDVPFEEARDDLATEFQADAAKRAIADRRNALEDVLAGGGTVEDLAKQPDFTLGTIDYNAESEDPIAGYPAFRQAAEAAQPGDFPELVQLDDGGLIALRLDGVTPAAARPFEEVRDQVTEAWQDDALHKALIARAEEIRTAVQNGTNLSDFGTVNVTGDITREGNATAAPSSVVETAFGLDEGAAQVIDTPEWVGVLRVDSVKPPAQDDEGAVALKTQLSAQIEGALAQDAQQMFTQTIADTAGVQINQAVIDAVHAQIP
ncbi:peptidylprolyl isomerase [Falsirhodobacter sp. 20TX0035]|uniref:peptidylprolyl isomerase n=1 Tax=Falsirhodobacter sp. 20TX0035 TaxID=3022019 RepID=UPI00232E296A|nr:peptidylprolyl isomerase [Falsirhodobacter sp. 20TX0035]MDB6454442.1 SurA N-terminal domain-containing protein [Falsirhodobacter sp. 20TX0035]